MKQIQRKIYNGPNTDSVQSAIKDCHAIITLRSGKSLIKSLGKVS